MIGKIFRQFRENFKKIGTEAQIPPPKEIKTNKQKTVLAI